MSKDDQGIQSTIPSAIATNDQPINSPTIPSGNVIPKDILGDITDATNVTPTASVVYQEVMITSKSDAKERKIVANSKPFQIAKFIAVVLGVIGTLITASLMNDPLTSLQILIFGTPAVIGFVMFAPAIIGTMGNFLVNAKNKKNRTLVRGSENNLAPSTLSNQVDSASQPMDSASQPNQEAILVKGAIAESIKGLVLESNTKPELAKSLDDQGTKLQNITGSDNGKIHSQPNKTELKLQGEGKMPSDKSSNGNTR